MEKPSILISGGTRGIGKAIVARFLSEGFQVFTCGSSESSVRKLLSEHPSENLFAEVVDLESRAAIQQWVSSVEKQTGFLNILVNNAGIFLPGSIEQEEAGVFEKVISVNLAAAYHLSRACLPMLRRAAQAHIFSISSTAGIMAYPNGGSYCISKFGMMGLTKTLREELKPSGIRVTAIIPGATHTDSWAGSGLPAERFMRPEDIASVIHSAWQMPAGTVLEEVLIRPQAGDI
jgi:NAD(P)-dependent dehydrogenase (short-subunit alcohol dehydrogenase family)